MSLLSRLPGRRPDGDDLAPFAERLRFQGPSNVDGRLTMTIIEEQDDNTSVRLLQSMVVSMIKHLGDAENYVETVTRCPGVSPDRFVFRVERANGSTPHELRKQAETKAERLEWTLRQVQGHVTLLERLPDMYRTLVMDTEEDQALHRKVLAASDQVMAGIRSLLDGDDCDHCVAADLDDTTNRRA